MLNFSFYTTDLANETNRIPSCISSRQDKSLVLGCNMHRNRGVSLHKGGYLVPCALGRSQGEGKRVHSLKFHFFINITSERIITRRRINVVGKVFSADSDSMIVAEYIRSCTYPLLTPSHVSSKMNSTRRS